MRRTHRGSAISYAALLRSPKIPLLLAVLVIVLAGTRHWPMPMPMPRTRARAAWIALHRVGRPSSNR